MSSDGQSLLDATPGELFDPAVTSTTTPRLAARGGSHTGELLFSRERDLYEQIAKALAEGESRKSIAKRLEVSRNTVAAVWRREAQSLSAEQLKQQAARELRMLSTTALDRVREVLESDTYQPGARDLQSLSVSAAVLIDKAELLSGGATARVEVVAPPGDDEYEAALARARSARVIDAEVVTRIEAVPGGQKAAEPAAGAAGPDVAHSAPGGEIEAGGAGRDAARTDCLSVGNTRNTLPNSGTLTGDVLRDVAEMPGVAVGVGCGSVGADGLAGAAMAGGAGVANLEGGILGR